jgi:hypothetical protein
MKAIGLLLAIISTTSLSYAAIECQVLYAPHPASPMTNPSEIRMQSLELNGNNEASIQLKAFDAKVMLEKMPSGKQFFTAEIAKNGIKSRNTQSIASNVLTSTQLAVTTLVIDKEQVTVTCSQY